MPVNNPAPAIKPPKARDVLGQDQQQFVGGATQNQTTQAPQQPQASQPQLPEGQHIWQNPYDTPEKQTAYLDELRQFGAQEGTYRTQDWADAEANRLQRAWGLPGSDAGAAAAGAAGGAPAPVQPTSGDQGGADIVNDMMASMGAGNSFGGATPAGGNALNAGVTGFAQDSLNAPGRYDIDLVRDSINLIDSDLENARQNSLAQLDEFNAQRGRVGSTFEAQDRGQLEGELNRQRQTRLVDLQERIAQTVMGDRKTASDIATDVGRFGLDQQAVNLRAQELQQQAQLEGRAMDIEEARLRAQNEQFAQNLAQRQSEFAQTMGTEGRRLQEQARQFSMSHAESIAGRLQQESQFARSLDSEESRFAMSIGLEQRALDLQERGMNMDEAFRQAELELEDFVQRRSLELQEEGMAQDEAYRWAALESQNDIAREQLAQNQQSIDNTNTLSQLDIILRALASGQVDASEIEKYMGGIFGGNSAVPNAGPTLRTDGEGGQDYTAMLDELVRTQGGG